MNVYKMSADSVCEVILRVAAKYGLTVRQIGIGSEGSYFIVLNIKTNDKISFGNYISDLNDIFLGTADEQGNVLDTEANIMATGYDGAIILGSTSDAEFTRHMLVASTAGARVVYEDGAMYGRE